MAGSAAFAALAIPGAIAAATPLTVTCTHLSGNTTTVSISGCSGPGVTAPNNATATGKLTVSTDTIKWTNGKKSIITYKYGTVTPDACVAKTNYASTEIKELAGTKISGGTALKLVGGAGSGKVCLYTSTLSPPAPAMEVNLGNVKF